MRLRVRDFCRVIGDDGEVLILICPRPDKEVAISGRKVQRSHQ